jgi:hypothetical protein
MRYFLAAFAKLRAWIDIPINRPILRIFKLVAELLAPFGSDRGGMSEAVVTGQERRCWRLLAEDGDGPFIPAIAIWALLRREASPVGAGPALEAITLEEAEHAMTDLRVRTDRTTELAVPLFAKVLGSSFESLPAPIKATHVTMDNSHWQGKASVLRGQSLLSSS